MLEDDVHLTYSLEDALKSELICISIRSQNLPDLMQKIVSAGVQGKTFVCMKGIEVSSLRRLSEIAEDAVGGSNDVAVWLGPGHVQEFWLASRIAWSLIQKRRSEGEADCFPVRQSDSFLLRNGFNRQ